MRSISSNSITISRQVLQFIKLFESYLPQDIYYLIDEEELARDGLNGSIELLIIPAFMVKRIVS